MTMPRGNFLVNLDDDNKVSIFYFWKHLEEDATLTAGLLLQMVQILPRRPEESRRTGSYYAL